MAGRYPKPDEQRVNRTTPQFGWIDLPREHEGDPPALPHWRLWNPATVEWWAELWRKPQAVMWEPTGSTLWTLACLYDDLISARADAAKVSAEMRQHEDRHGLNPKAMLQLRWRVAEEAETKTRPRRTARASAERRKRLKVV